MGGHDGPQNVFDHRAQTHRRRKLKLSDFQYQPLQHQKKLFWFPRLSSVTMAMSVSGSTQDFLKLSFHMFPTMKF